MSASESATSYTTIESTSTVTNVITVYPVDATPSAGVSTAVNYATTTTGSESPAVTSSVSGCCVANTVTVTEKETIYVTVGTSSSSSASVMPIQSSTTAFYPTGSAPSESGVAGSSSKCMSTGFITVHKATGGSSYAPIPTGSAMPSGYGKRWF